MKTKLKNLKMLLTRLKNTRFVIQLGNEEKTQTKYAYVQPETQIPNRKYGNFQATVLLNPGFTALVIKNEAYNDLINGLVEADHWTGVQYSENVFQNSTIIKN